jgi:SPOR domain
MNVVKRRWPDLLIGLLVLLLLVGFAALLLGKNVPGTVSSTPADQPGASTSSTTTPPPTSSTTPNSSATPPPRTQATQTPTPRTQPSTVQTPDPQTPDPQASSIPTIPAAPVTSGVQPSGQPSAVQPTAPPTDGQPVPVQPATPTAAGAAPRSGGAVATSEARTPTRNDYRISLGKFGDRAALQATTAGVGSLGYTVYPISVVNGVVAQVGPFASREEAAQALADIQRALPGALLYPPRNAPSAPPTSATPNIATQSTAAQGTATQNTVNTSAVTPPDRTPAVAATPQPATPDPAPQPAPAPNGPVYLQVGAYNSTTAAQTAVSRVRDMGLEPSVNAPAGKLVTVVVGPFQGQALIAAEAKLQSGGLESFRVK